MDTARCELPAAVFMDPGLRRDDGRGGFMDPGSGPG
jgi:hypothetical protein